MRKQLNAKTLAAALAISVVLFGAGMAAGLGLSGEKLGAIEDDMRSVVREVQNFQLQFLLFDVLGAQASCPLLADTLTDINERSYEVGAKLTSFGRDEVIAPGQYGELKKEYSRLLVSYWLLAEKFKANCASEATTVLYFFSAECERCDDQGFVLTYLKSKYGDRLLVFALDADTGEASVKALMDYYEIERFPSLVVNGALTDGFVPLQELEPLLSG